MASIMKCPLCGTILAPVGKKGKRMRCENCHSVFDVSQLNSYYGVGSAVHSGAAPHDYETAHMHAVEMQRQAQTAQAQSAQPQAIQAQVPPQQVAPPPQAPIKAPFGAQPQGAPVASKRPQQKTPTKKAGSGVGKAIFWIVIICCIALPLLFAFIAEIEDSVFEGDLIAWLDSLDSKSSSSSSASKPSGKLGTTGSSKSSASSGRANSDYTPIGQDMNLNATARIGRDSSGKDVLVVEYTWTNCDTYDTSFGVAVRTKAQLDGTTLTNAYPKDGTAGYNGDSFYAMVKKGQTGTATEAFTPYRGAKTGTVVVSATAWNDELMMNGPPVFTWEFDLAALYAEAGL